MVRQVPVLDRTERERQSRGLAKGALVILENFRAREALLHEITGVGFHGLRESCFRGGGGLVTKGRALC